MKRWAMILGLLAAGCGDKEGDTGEGAEDTGHEGHDSGDTADAADDTADGETGPDGAALFQSRCASCHGEDGQGIGGAPNLSNELGHHSDEEIVSIILNGEGPMPPIDVTAEEAQAIVDYMRATFTN